jgi:hypothetical protein
MKSKAFIPVVVTLVLVMLAAFIWAMFSSMGAFSPKGSPENQMPNLSDVKHATNVETFRVQGGSDVMVFDIERDGQILTCTSKRGYDSGVACAKK